MSIDSHQVWATDQMARLPKELNVANPTKDGDGSEPTKFFDSMPISEWQVELANLRKTDLDLAEQREQQIINEIRLKLMEIPYEKNNGTPDAMISGGKKNCEGASILASIILEQLDIRHRLLIIQSPTKSPGHVLVLPVSCKGNVTWSEMTDTSDASPIDESSFKQKNGNLVKTPLADLLLSEEEGIQLLLTDNSFKKRAGRDVWGSIDGLSVTVDLLEPVSGRKVIVLARQASNEIKNGDYNRAKEIYELLIKTKFRSTKNTF